MKFFKDFWSLSRWEFYVKYFLPFILIVFSWTLIGNLIEVNYRKDYLNKVKGRIVIINENLTKDYRNNQDYELVIYLDNYSNYFRITDNYKYKNIQKKLKFGDEVEIYFRPKYLVAFGLGKQTDIYQLEYKKEILFDLSQRKRNSKGLIILSLIFLLIFGSVYYFANKKLRSKKSSS